MTFSILSVLYYVYCRSNEVQYLELFLSDTIIDQNLTISSVTLSMNSELTVEEPLSITSVIVFGIEGDCILEEMTVNASIDDIFGNILTYVCTYVRMYIQYLAKYVRT